MKQTRVRFTVADGTEREADLPPKWYTGKNHLPDRFAEDWQSFLWMFDSDGMIETTDGDFVRLRYIVRAWEQNGNR